MQPNPKRPFAWALAGALVGAVAAVASFIVMIAADRAGGDGARGISSALIVTPPMLGGLIAYGCAHVLALGRGARGFGVGALVAAVITVGLAPMTPLPLVLAGASFAAGVSGLPRTSAEVGVVIAVATLVAAPLRATIGSDDGDAAIIAVAALVAGVGIALAASYVLRPTES